MTRRDARPFRSYWRERDPQSIGEVANRLTGSADVFRHQGRSPRASINHVTVHDGFTLADTTMFARASTMKRMAKTTATARTTTGSNNWGVEGPSDDPDIGELRKRAGTCSHLFPGKGMPLLLAGDEVSSSQQGNSNACARTAKSAGLTGRAWRRESYRICFATRILRGQYTQLQSPHWIDGMRTTNRRMTISAPRAQEMTPEDWSFPEARFLAYVLAANKGRAAALS